MDSEKTFLKLSQLLTGVNELDDDIARKYYGHLQQRMGIYLDELFGIYKEVAEQPEPLKRLLERIKTDPKVLHVAKQVVRIWYISQFKELPESDPTKPPKPELYAGHWKKGVLWDIIKAHPPAYSDQPHGYWTEKPRGV